MGGLCAIHQPNFFPWLGYFDKVRRADVFVFLDDVAYPKAGHGMGSWSNRVQLNIQGRAAWVGCPVRREAGVQLIRDIRIDDSQPWRSKFLKTLNANYRRARNYTAVMAVIEPLIRYETDLLVEFNINAITRLTDVLQLSCRFLRQSELATEKTSTALLVEVCQKVEANSYLCGGGADGYQDDALFAAEGVQLVYQNFVHPRYGGSADDRTLTGLSVIDFLMKDEEAR